MRSGGSKRLNSRQACRRPLLLYLLLSSGWASAQAPETERAPVGPEPGQQPAVTAQTPPDQQPIVITGSRIPRPNLTAPSPVSVINKEEVTLQGAVLTEDLINSLPQVRPDQGIFINTVSRGTSTVDLRALGASRTLVLVNGRRLLPGDENNPAPDINAVPTTLIKRVEVLTGGASSVYGSDAVAGVVNFILETDLKGLRVDGQTSFFQHDNRAGDDITQPLVGGNVGFPTGNVFDGGRQDINAAFGTDFLDGRGNVTVYGGYRTVSAVSQSRRDFSACALNGEADGSLTCSGSVVSADGLFFTNFGAFHPSENRTFIPGFPDLFNFAPYVYFQRPDRRYTAGGFAKLELTDAFNPYLEVMFMDDRSDVHTAPSGNFANTTSINCDNPLLSAQQLSLVCFAGNLVGQTPVLDNEGNLIRIDGAPIAFTDPVSGGSYFRGRLQIRRRNVEGGSRQIDLRHRNVRAVGGVKGELGRGLAYDASYLSGIVKAKSENTNYVFVPRLGRALDVITDPATGQPACRSFVTGQDPNCVPWDVFTLGAVTPEAAAYLTVPASSAGTVKQRVATAFITASLQEWGIRSPWAEDGPSLNVGVEYRKDRLEHRPDATAQSGNLAGFPPDFPVSGSTGIKELFAEARVPLVKHRLIEDLALEGGYRQSWHTNGDNKFKTSAYKLALEFAPIRDLRLRASQQRAVRAPNIQELFGPQLSGALINDPCAGVSPVATAAQCALTGVSAAQYGNVIANPFASIEGYNAIVGGNPGLKPETARTRAIGIVLQPRFLRNFNATVDWFDIRLKGSIAAIFPQTIMDTCIATGDPLFCGRINRDVNGSLWMTQEGFVDARLANVGAFKVRGIDVGSTYTQELRRFGSANGQFLGTWLDRYIVDNGGLATPYDCAGLYGYICGFPLPRWRHKARLTWYPSGRTSLSLHWRHIGKAKIDLTNEDLPVSAPFTDRIAQVDAQNYFDLTGLLRFQKAYQLRLGVQNIFDRQPPVLPGGDLGVGSCGTDFCSGNTFPQLYDPLGRYVFVGATVDF